ncbi:MAG TPA: hypothetical protein VMI32_06090 [Candidatus Solibacter sp.]|nr:hypothetical protein [Candidatus Solibacter sp.]
MANIVIETSRVEKFLDTLKNYVGATIWQGAPSFVSQGAPYTIEPCMYDAALFQEALDSGKAEKRVLTVASISFTHKLEIIAAKSHRYRITVRGVDIDLEVANPPLTPKDEELVRKLVTTGRKDENVRKELERRGIRLA